MKEKLKKLGQLLFNKTLFRVKEYNKKNLSDKSYILAPNHTSDLDGPIIWSNNENLRIMAKKECFENKLLGNFLTKVDVVKVDRDKHNGTEIREAIKYLNSENNNIFMLFPQGTISDINKNAISRIKPGAFYISAITNVPIIPVFIEQPRIFKKSRVIYGEEMYVNDIYDNNGKIDKEKIKEYRKKWQDEIFKLEYQALKVEDRPFRKLKLKDKHRNNNS